MNTRRSLLQFFLAHRAERTNERIRTVIKNLTPLGKVLLSIFIAGLVISTVALSYEVYAAASTEIPARGGEIEEGILGIPRFVNPLFALGHADHDLIELVYAGLYTYNTNGEIVPELAEGHTISEEGRTYTVTLKDAYFHDGAKVTANDVVYTVRQAQNPLVKSTIQGDWSGVSVRAIDDKTVEFTISERYVPFIHNLTIGILPSHIWDPIGAERLAFSEQNLTPIGAGPYEIRGMRSARDGTRSFYTLSAFDDYILGEPLIPRIELSFYANGDDLLSAYKRGSISSSAYLPEEFVAEAADTEHIVFPIRRIFALFFNQEESVPLSSYEVREGLDRAAEKKFLVRTVFSGYATPIYSPYPFTDNIQQEKSTSARELLDEAGWEINEETGIRESSAGTPLSFSLSTALTPDLERTAELLKRNFENVGAQVTLNTHSTEELLQEVIRPRTYDALLFGQVIGRENDLFGYWHSSQLTDPGLNIALYANEEVDSLLEEMRTEAGDVSYNEFNKLVREDMPALFLYHPNLPYVHPPKIFGLVRHDIVSPHERFIDIHKWYIQTRRLWNIFSS